MLEVKVLVLNMPSPEILHNMQRFPKEALYNLTEFRMFTHHLAKNILHIVYEPRAGTHKSVLVLPTRSYRYDCLGGEYGGAVSSPG